MPSPIPRQERRRSNRSYGSPALAAFPGNGSGRLLHYQFRGLIGCSLALRPARSRAAHVAAFASKAPAASLPPPPLRLLPAGATQLPGGDHTHGRPLPYHGAPAPITTSSTRSAARLGPSPPPS